MAEVYGRLTGQPAVCLATLGPGATNLITGVADSNMDRAPMLALTGQGSTQRLHKESHQIMDVVSMFRPVTKWATSVLHQDNIAEIFRKAVRIARSEKPGAVLIELPEDIAKRQTETVPITPRRYRRAVAPQEMIEHAAGLLREARRPVILAGNGCIRKRASAELRALCERTGVGVISTFMGKGSVDMDAEYCLFTIGLSAKDIPACAVDAADLVIAIGFDMVEYHPSLWNPQGDKRILHIDFTPAEIDAKYHPEVELVGDIAQALAAVNQCLEGVALNCDLSQQAATRRDMLEDFATYADDAQIGVLRPQKVLADVRRAMGPNDILLSDVGAHKMWIARQYQCHEPNTCLIPNGFCSMGFALPGAIAAGLVHPERRILGIAGDAGFLMNVQEMETARRLGVSIVMMVWEDKAYGLIAWKQETEFGRHTDLAFDNPEWDQLARSFGWGAYRCADSAALADTLERAFEEPGPSLLVVPIDYRENERLTQRLGDITCPI